jgi:excisionase family DNA binding protein
MRQSEERDLEPLFQALVSALIERIAADVAARVRSEPTVQPRLLTVAQAAVYLGRTPKAVRDLAARGTVPTVRTDGRVMFDVNDLDRWIEVNKVH